MFKNLLVPLDGSHLAETALPPAAVLAQELHASVILIHVIERNAPKEIHGDQHLTNEGEACNYLETIAAQTFPESVQVEKHVHSEEVRNVARSIVDHASEYDPDLIILTTHGEGGLRDWVVGNIAQQVITLGQTPVLLLRPSDKPALSPPKFTFLVALVGNPAHEAALDGCRVGRKDSGSSSCSRGQHHAASLWPAGRRRDAICPEPPPAMLEMKVQAPPNTGRAGRPLARCRPDRLLPGEARRTRSRDRQGRRGKRLRFDRRGHPRQSRAGRLLGWQRRGQNQPAYRHPIIAGSGRKGWLKTFFRDTIGNVKSKTGGLPMFRRTSASTTVTTTPTERVNSVLGHGIN